MSDSYRVRITGDLDTLAPLLASDSTRFRELLGRDLDEPELATFDTLTKLSGVVADVVQSLAWRDRVLACRYLQARVPSANPSDILRRVEALEIRAEQRQLSNREEDQICAILGRRLAEAELAIFDSLNEITPEIEAVAATLLLRYERILACDYLHERVPTDGRWVKARAEHIENKYRRR